MRRHALLAALLLAVGGCSSPAGSDAPDSASGGTAAPADPPTTSDDVTGTAAGYPDSIAVLGHSGATGENSDPERPGTEARSNSWATGTSPDVRSVYDGDAFGAIVDRPEHWSSDLDHFSVQGHAAAAEAAWTALHDAGVLPVG